MLCKLQMALGIGYLMMKSIVPGFYLFYSNLLKTAKLAWIATLGYLAVDV